jgi:prophage regulatory protein
MPFSCVSFKSHARASDVEKLIREPAVRQALGLRGVRSTYDQISSGLLPRPVSIGLRAKGWPISEIETIVAARVAGASTEEVRELVKGLVETRKRALSDLRGMRERRALAA